MKKHLSFLSAGLMAALLGACSDGIVDIGDSPINTNANLKVLVIDASTNALVPGAEVTMLATGAKKTTNEIGQAIFGGVRVGSHALQLSKEGYATAVAGAGIKCQGSEGVCIANETVADIQLYPATSKLEGSLFYRDDNGANKPAEGVKIRLVLGEGDGGGFVKSEIVAEVGTDGKYVFDSLPAVDYTLYIPSHKFGNVTYAPREIFNGYGTSLVFGETTQRGASFLSDRVTAPFVVTSRTADGIEPNKDIEFEFSSAVDVAKSSVSVSYASYPYDGAVYDLIWGDKKLTLKLFGGNTWTDDVDVTLNLVSTDGVELSGGRYFDIKLKEDVVDLTKEKVAGFAVTTTATATTTFADASFSLTWTKLTGASYYYVYASSSTDGSVFKYVGYYGQSTDLPITISGSTLASNVFGKAGTDAIGTVQFVVIALESYGSDNRTPFYTAEKKP